MPTHPDHAASEAGASQAQRRAQILKAALTLVLRDGFRAVSVDAIAAEAGVGKTTIYRRWPNKAAVVMDAFLADIGPQIPYPAADSSSDEIPGSSIQRACGKTSADFAG